jgi:hypothetical protein
MNMTYVGAIKTGIYGLYMLVTGQSFSVASWRLLGILFTASGIILFGVIVRKRISLTGLAIILFLIFTDLTLMLTSRFDWGPVALSAFLRILLIAIWLEGELSAELRPKNSLWIGILFGISMFEKLNNIVLIVPILLMFFSNPLRRTFRHLKALFFGGVIGMFPLILANLLSLHQSGRFISFQLQNVLTTEPHSLGNLIKTIGEYLSLGSAGQVEGFILGVNHHLNSLAEGILLAVLFCLIIIGRIVFRRQNSTYFRLSAVLLLSYFSVMISIYFLPAPTSVHHWIIATPFQYVAVGMFLLGLVEQNPNTLSSASKLIFTAPLLLLAISRVSGAVAVEQSFLKGDASYKWDQSLTTMAKFAADQSAHAIFIAADWGIANQMICFLNGNPGIVHEFIGLDQNRIEQVLNIFRRTEAADIYLVFLTPPYFTSLETRQILITDIASSLASEWANQPLEQQLEGLKSVAVYKYSRISP